MGVRHNLLMFAKYSVGAQRAAPALARHLLCPKTTLYSAGINSGLLALIIERSPGPLLLHKTLIPRCISL